MTIKTNSAGQSLWIEDESRSDRAHPMTSPLPIIVDSEDPVRTMKKPYAEVTETILAFDRESFDSEEDAAKVLAFDVIGKLRRLGFLNDIGLTAIKAEEAGDDVRKPQ